MNPSRSGRGLSIAGFVLAGGKSSRMGADKALLPYRGGTLVEHIARVVTLACGSATIVGPLERYSHLGLAVIADRHAGSGPVSGIHAALEASPADWILVAACDMPGLTAEFLRALIDEAQALEGSVEIPDALLPIPPGGCPEPLCALYNKRCLPLLGVALDRGVLKVTRALSGARLRLFPVNDPSPLQNVNTPSEWEASLGA
jgi:molybdopterin-guanine dinucleotide biosynthesis protein A